MEAENTDATEDAKRGQWLRYMFALIAALVGCALYLYYFTGKAYVEVELQVDKPGKFNIYWTRSGEAYSEKNRATIAVNPQRTSYGFILTNLKGLDALRIDTHDYEGHSILKKLVVRQSGWEPVVLQSVEALQRLQPANQIGEFHIDADGLSIQSTGADPYFSLPLVEKRISSPFQEDGPQLLAIGLILFVLFLSMHRLLRDFRFVPILLFGILLLVIAMARISAPHVHPDEYVHLAAAKYYFNNWLPPVIEDPAIRHTYSVYGASRLNNGEVYYLFAGKVGKFYSLLHVSEPFSLRLFNVLLFGIIFLLTSHCKYARIAAIPCLVSPQIWYVFGYCNSDAFAIFVTFLMTWQIIDPKSLLSRHLKGGNRFSDLLAPVAIGCLLGIVLLLKKNYYPFVAFVLLVLAVKLFWETGFTQQRKRAALCLLVIIVIACGVMGLRVGIDYSVNGLDRSEKMAQLMEITADPLYNPKTPFEEQHFYLNRKARGVSLRYIITQDKWCEKTFRTGFGSYGYFTISGSDTYYNLVRWTGTILLLGMFGSIFLRGGWLGAGLTSGAIGLSGALICVALYLSWTFDFQAQGRYLFPVFAILGLLYGWGRKLVQQELFCLGVMLMTCLGVYSFIFQGLLLIPRITF